jgi:hypothetical protein
MMLSRKILVLSLTLIVVSAVFIPIAVLESKRTPDWQTELMQYLSASGVAAKHVQVWVAEARRVNTFSDDLLIAAPTGWPWQGIEQIPRADKIWCLRLKTPPEYKSETEQQGIEYDLLASYHDDGLWRVGWLVHEFRPDVGKDQRQALFSKIGCHQWQEVSISKE